MLDGAVVLHERPFCPPHLATSGDTAGYQLCVQVATGIQWVEARAATATPYNVYRMVPASQKAPGPKFP